jgi:hypothetical protein
MTVTELMEKNGFTGPGWGRKCRCPSGTHEDNHPSAIINDSSVYCFSCHKSYNKKWLENKFNAQLDSTEEYKSTKLEKRVLFSEL